MYVYWDRWVKVKSKLNEVYAMDAVAAWLPGPLVLDDAVAVFQICNATFYYILLLKNLPYSAAFPVWDIIATPRANMDLTSEVHFTSPAVS